MKIYYMERGAGASNLHMRFNLSYITPGSVMLSKEITGTEALDDDMDFSLVEFPYQIWYKMSPEDEPELLTNDNQHIRVKYQNSTQKVDFRPTYTPPHADTPIENVYFINPDMVAEICFIEKTYEYRIVECAVNTEVYDTVSVEGIDDALIDETAVSGNISRKNYGIPWEKVDNRKTVAFKNHVNPEGIRTLWITKALEDESGNPLTAEDDKTTFNFRLYLTNGADDADKLALADMVKYRVRDPHNNLCVWSVDAGGFVSGGKSDYKTLTQEEKDSVTFETSIYGQISRIPAGFTIEVPGLPVGTIFKVEERPNEMPLGYKLLSYERDPATYQISDGDTPNSGRVRESESPSMTVHNRRCFEIMVQKEWTDKKYVELHDSIYTAVYVKGNLLDGTVKQIKDPHTDARYTFDSLLSGCTFSDYEVREVELTNPEFDAEGNLTGYESINKKLSDGEPTVIAAIAKGSTTKENYSYSVSYEKGTEKSTASGVPTGGNVREDKIINTRSGGIVMSLYKMGTKDPLPGGTFTLQRFDKATQTYVNEGTYISDENGRITILYEHKLDTEADYILTQTASPDGYIGLNHPVTFSVTSSDEIIMTPDANEWHDWDKPASTDKLIAYINVYNKPYTLEVYKFDGTSTSVSGLKEAYFELHRGVKGGQGGIVKDYAPMPGYENLVTGENGIITGIDSNLAPNNYYLTEKTPPKGYTGLKGDVIFAITPLGRLELISSPVGSGVTLDEGEYGDTYRYLLNIPNYKTDQKALTVSKTVTGRFGNKAYDFGFTFTTTDTDETEYDYEIIDEDGNPITGLTIKSKQTFTLRHGQKAIFTLPADTDVTIEEFDYSVNGYTTTVAVDSEEPVAAHSVTKKISADTQFAFTNHLDGLVPTGVSLPVGGMIAMALIILGGVMFTIVSKRRLREEL